MRILKAEITGFGHYRQQVFDFDAHNQLFYGENEAGKSTLYQFIYAMLFGFTKKSAKKRDYTPQDGSAFGGRLWIETTTQHVIKIERFRQVDRGKPKIWIEDQEVDTSLDELIAPLTSQMFQDIYTFQQEQLSQIDHLQDRDFHEALLSLGISGSQQLIEMAKQEERTSQLLFRPRGRNLPLNQKIVALEHLQEKILEKEQQEATVQHLYQQLSEMKQESQQLDQQVQKARLKQQQFEQQRLNWPLYEEWQELKQSQPTTPLSLETQQEVEQIYQQYQTIRQTIQVKTDQIAQIEQDQTSERYFFYLDHETEIKQLKTHYLAIMNAFEEEKQLLRAQQEIKSHLDYYAQHWRFTKEAPPQSIDEQLYEELTYLEQNQMNHQQLSEKIKWYQEQQQQLEVDVTQLEERLLNLEPETTTIKSPLVVASLGGAIGVGLFFFNIWLGLGLIVVSIGYATMRLRHKPDHTAIDLLKEQWQAQLAKSAQGQKELASLRQEYEVLNKQENERIQRLQPFFGNAPQEQWYEILQTYQQESTRFYECIEQEKEIQAKLATIEPILTQTLSLLKPFYAWFSIATLPLDQQIQMIFSFDEEMQQIKLERSQNPSMQLAREIQALRQQEKTLLEDAKELFDKGDITQIDEVPLLLKQWTTRRENVKRQVELEQMLGQLFPKPIKKARWEQNIAENEKMLADYLLSYKEQTLKIQRLELELEQFQEDGTLDEWYQRRAQLEDEVRQMSVTWASQKVHAALLTQLATTRSEDQFPQLMARVSEYFSLLTDQRYQEVLFYNKELRIVTQQGQSDIYQLSTGTKDQLIMAFRFAYLALQQNYGPVIIDDGWLHYDHKRKYHLAKLFANFGQDRQVICLSSDREMVSYYQELQQEVKMFKEGM